MTIGHEFHHGLILQHVESAFPFIWKLRNRTFVQSINGDRSSPRRRRRWRRCFTRKGEEEEEEVGWKFVDRSCAKISGNARKISAEGEKSLAPPPTDVTNRTLKISFETKAEFGSGVVFLPDFSRWMKKNFKGGGRDGRLFGQVWTGLRRGDFFFLMD